MFMSGRYILDENGEPMIEPDLMRWARWYEDFEYRRLARDDLGARGVVSTIFLGLDHSFDRGALPVLWESMIFGGPHDGEQFRYTSRREALDGHAALVEACRITPRRIVFYFWVYDLARRLLAYLKPQFQPKQRRVRKR
jgi:hypothetical protein